MTETKEVTPSQRIVWSLLASVFLLVGFSLIYMVITENVLRPALAVVFGLASLVLGVVILGAVWKDSGSARK